MRYLQLDFFFDLNGHFLCGDSKLCTDLWPWSRTESSPRSKHDWRAKPLRTKAILPETNGTVLQGSSRARIYEYRGAGLKGCRFTTRRPGLGALEGRAQRPSS